MDNKSVIVKVLCCLIGVSSFSYIGLRMVELVKERDVYVTVKGLSDRVVASDTAVCTVRIARDTDQLKSVQEERQKDKKLVLEFLRTKGFDDASIEEMPPRVEDNYRYSSKVEGKGRYSVHDDITIKSSDVELVKKTIIELLTYVDANGSGNGVVTCDAKYRYTNLSELKLDMIKEATIDARNRAKHIAETVGSKITRLRNLVTGQFSIVSADSSAADNNGDWEEREAVMKRLRVVVTGTFGIE
jgi:hypothetical protein